MDKSCFEAITETISAIDEVMVELESHNPYNRRDVRFPSVAEQKLSKARAKLIKEIQDEKA